MHALPAFLPLGVRIEGRHGLDAGNVQARQQIFVFRRCQGQGKHQWIDQNVDARRIPVHEVMFDDVVGAAVAAFRVLVAQVENRNHVGALGFY